MKTLRFLCVALCMSPLPACLANPDVAMGDQLTLSVLSINTRDTAGNHTDGTTIVRRPVIELETSVAIDPRDPPIYVFEGASDETLLADLASPPLRNATLARQIGAAITIEGTTVRIEPHEVLRPNQQVTVAVAAWAMGASGERWIKDAAAFVTTLQVSADATAGASAVASWPAHGAAGVAPNLAYAVLAFDGALSTYPAMIALTRLTTSASSSLVPDAVADRVDADVTEDDCATLGMQASTCLRVTPHHALEVATTYSITVDNRFADATSLELSSWSTRFTTATQVDDVAPTPRPMPCALDETEWASGCALIASHSFTLRIAADEAFTAHVRDDACLRRAAVAFGGETTLTIDGLIPTHDYALQIKLADAAGNTFDTQATFITREPPPSITITEVRADPLGAEPAQEFVELFNFGVTAIDLVGFSLTDDAFDDGDLIERSVLLHPGGRALLVADDFDAFDTRDVLPAPGATLVRIGTSLANAGLSNSGEPLYLRDPSGARISVVPRMPSAGGGVCLVRAGDVEDGLSENFVHDANATCTPGL